LVGSRYQNTSILLKLALAILSGLAAVGCAPKTAVLQQPVAVPEYEALFAEGQAVFREATPEGYERGAKGLFLALEQKLNQEDTAPA
jgi:hypothetical protein